MPHVLVLNASYEPLGVVPLRRALVLVLESKAVCLEESGAFLHSESRTVPAPSVVRLKRFVKVPYRGPVPLTRRALFARDGGRCVYCGGVATSVDHVIPRSRGGLHVWDNVVASCSAVQPRQGRPAPHGAGVEAAQQAGAADRAGLADHRDRAPGSSVAALSAAVRRG